MYENFMFFKKRTAIKIMTNKQTNTIQDNDSIFKTNIERGIKDKIIIFNDDSSKITYNCSRKYTTSFKNPEEKVRASYFVELVLD
ncbi:MAG: hypothetical protein KDK36_06300, partial [Leptospiraceae bacterium]|nr:hypothetical protein [Leptospiraceae bacterium]